MNSNHVRWGSLILIVCTLILGAGPLTNLFPGLPAQWVPLVTLAILAVEKYFLAQTTPTTNAQTPDNAPPKPPSQ
jgi:hypothetical protein